MLSGVLRSSCLSIGVCSVLGSDLKPGAVLGLGAPLMRRRGGGGGLAEDIRKEIEEETIRHLAKVRKPVSPDPIQLAIYSPNVPNLTMVDMPGGPLLPAHDHNAGVVARSLGTS